MRRATPSFTIEVRRAAKRTNGARTPAWLSEARPNVSTSAGADPGHLGTPIRASAPREQARIDAPPPVTGRILPSLVNTAKVSALAKLHEAIGGLKELGFHYRLVQDED